MFANATMNRRAFVAGSAGAAGLLAVGAAAVPAIAEEQAAGSEEVASPYYTMAKQELAYYTTDGEVAFEADPIPEDAISETLECDLVIAGAGLAGICAAESAAENGLKVILLEKSDT